MNAAKNNAVADGFGRTFTIVREFAAPRELVWRACTEAHHLAQWWGPEGFSAPVCEWDAKPGNKIHVVMRAPDGTDFPMGGEFREVVPQRKLVTITGGLDAQGRTLFEIRHTLTLTGRGGRTKLTMRSRVIRTTPGAGRYIGGFETGMTMSLARLEGHLAQGTEPLVFERTLNAPAATVWKALTSVRAMKEWYFEMEGFKPRVGCAFGFTVEHKGRTYIHRCKITAVIPQKRLAYTWRYAGVAGNSMVSFELTPKGRRTHLRLTHLGLESFPAHLDFARNNFVNGWTAIIGSNLPKFLKTQP
jgi:uncharacterized protein YndB with AHSA1/START domain